jgi:hypothetical protein
MIARSTNVGAGVESRDATIAKSLCDHSKCTELTLEQHDFDECPTPQPAGRLNVGYFQVLLRAPGVPINR